MENKQSLTNIAEVITKRRRTLYNKKGYISLLLRIILLAVIGYVIFTQVFLITRAHGNDMFPAIKDGDLVIAYRLQNKFIKNDIVVYKEKEKSRIGRIVARGMDVVFIDDTGALVVNDSIQSGIVFYPTLAKEEGTEYPLKVPEGNVFLLGDHRTQSKDSRDFGPIDLIEVKAKIITILRRRGL